MRSLSLSAQIRTKMVALLKLAFREEVDLVVLVLAAVFSILWLIWKLKSNNGGTNPSLPPGPRGLPIVGNLLSLDTELHSQFANLAKTYGPIMTLWLGKKVTIVISSPVRC
ncbi:putative unspecific monooxygenase [Helianthus annuus]|nr:putative unspecific monooxygenase [Helianthus annuus]